MNNVKKLKLFRTNLNLSQGEFAQPLGLPWHKIKDIETGRHKLTSEIMDKIKQVYPEIEDFMANKSENADDCITLEHIGIHPACGSGTCIDDEPVIRPVQLSNNLITKYLRCSDPNNLKTFTASGDSMSPSIEDGDLLLVDTGRADLLNSGIYIFSINNDWRCKRFNLKTDGTLEIISDNPKYGKELLTPDSGVELIVRGRVLKNMSRGL